MLLWLTENAGRENDGLSKSRGVSQQQVVHKLKEIGYQHDISGSR